MTGWNMPPGCNVRDIPGNDCPDPHPLSDKLWALLEAAGVPDSIMIQADEILNEALEVVPEGYILDTADPYYIED